MKNLRNSGANLTKMWTALSNLRDILHSSGSELPRLPDPLPPPSAAAVRNTRGTAKADGAPVVHTAQLVPVVQALIEAALATEQLREILDAGADEVKEAQKEAREAVKREKERWEAEGGAKNKVSSPASRFPTTVSEGHVYFHRARKFVRPTSSGSRILTGRSTSCALLMVRAAPRLVLTPRAACTGC